MWRLLLALTLLLPFSAAAEVLNPMKAPEPPAVSKYDRDLQNTPGISNPELDLLIETRQFARDELAKNGMGKLVTASFDQQECLKVCRSRNAGAQCEKVCVEQGYATLGQSPVNHNPSDVNCTGNHTH